MTAQKKLSSEKAAAAARALLAQKRVARPVTRLPVVEPVNVADVEEAEAAAELAAAQKARVAEPEKLMASAIESGKGKKRDRGEHSEKKSKKLKRIVCFKGFGESELAALDSEALFESFGNVMKVVFG